MWIRKVTRDRAKGVDSPIPTQVVSNEEFTPRPQNEPQKRVEHLIGEMATERAAKLKLWDKDVYLATVAGAKVGDTGADLALCLAVYSAARDTALPSDMVAIGEVALSGDVRPVPGMAQRLAEAARLGFATALVPAGVKAKHPGLRVIEVADLAAAPVATRVGIGLPLGHVAQVLIERGDAYKPSVLRPG